MSTNGKTTWFRRWFSRARSIPLDPARTDLIVVASSFDDAEPCSAALQRGRQQNAWVEDEEIVLRHHLFLPPDMIDDAAAIAAQDGYERAPGSMTMESPEINGYQPAVDGGVPIVLQRVQVLDALHCSQERSRMAGLAQRRGGIVLGWDALQPASDAGRVAD
ncbi:hypothetical protein BJD99_10210 [Rhodococcus sp. 1163]|uniref:hypothetical protein n=1 Tax=unclassified Rhodococcus (in: high G+C Gram-positive bacteria) TaxID=192944 RepID=UPI000A02B6A5|nr:hypothetical protein [Rhodococcus sp. 1163]ORI16870.1 hypothetical protein BJD99_10210 [Rhodococcus sp. 1163]